VSDPPQQVLAAHLVSGEHLLWCGQPGWRGSLEEMGPLGRFGYCAGLLLIGIPAIVILGALIRALLSDSGQLKSAAGLLAGIVFICGLVWALIREPLGGKAAREQTYYGVTDQRIVIVSGPPAKRQAASWMLSVLQKVTYGEGEDGWGSVYFPTLGSPTLGPLRNAREVFEIVQKAQAPTR